MGRDRIRERWHRDAFNIACNGMAWYAENSPNPAVRREMDRALAAMVEYSYVPLGESDDGERVRTHLFPEEYACAIAGFHLVAPGVPEHDYFAEAWEKNARWREEREARRASQRDAVAEYLAAHRGEKIVKKHAARELGVPYDRCLELFRELEEKEVS